ncbi:MAG: hypothetical protein GWP08_06890 [Nitrospiraceae bacterium]|nr:hypothetical protein [Nitrospiraceae bacterium]
MIPDFVQGAIAPVFTACNQDGSLDDDGQRAILDYLIETQAVSACFVRCGLGQLFTFDEADTRQLVKTACEHLDGKLPVLAGAMGIWDRNRDAMPDGAVYLNQAVELSKYAEGVGVAAVVHTMPEPMRPAAGQTFADAIVDYFQAIAGAVGVPVLIYQNPGTAEAYCVDEELVCRLADIPGVAGMKLSSASAEYIFNLTYALKGKDFGFIVGAETAFLAGLVTGARACIGQGATINPQTIKAVSDRYAAGDLQGAIEAQYSTNMLVQKAPNCVAFFKRWLAEKGYNVQPYSRSMSGNSYAEARKELSQEEYDAFKPILEAELAKY